MLVVIGGVAVTVIAGIILAALGWFWRKIFGRPAPTKDSQRPPAASQHLTVDGHAITLQSVNIAGDLHIHLESLPGDASKDVKDPFDEGMRRFTAKDYKSAILEFEKAMSAATDSEQISTLLLNCAVAAWFDQQFGLAQQYLVSAINQAKVAGNHHAVAVSQLTLAQLYLYTHQTGRAGPLIRDSLKTFVGTGDKSWEALGLSNLAVVLGSEGNVTSAREAIEAALALHAELGNRVGEANALGNIAVMMGRQFNESNDKEALLGEVDQLLFRALEIWLETGDKHGQAQTLELLGSNSFLRGRYEEALARYLRARSTFQANGNKVGLAGVVGNMGIVNLYSGNPEQAKRLLRESIDIFESVGVFEGPIVTFRRVLADLERS